MDEVTLKVKNMYEKYPYPSSNIVNVAIGNRVKRDLKERNFRLEGLTVLDAGCGTGEKAISLAKAFPNCKVIGWDITENSLKKARLLADAEKVKNVEFEHVDLIQVDVEKNKDRFDLIISWCVIHHLVDSVKGLKNLGSCLKRDGLMYVWVYGLLALETYEVKLFREVIHTLLPDNEFTYEKGIRVAQEIKNLSKMVNISPWKDFIMRIKWFLDRDVDKKQILWQIIKNFGKAKYSSTYDIGLVDLFLHAHEKEYNIDLVLDDVEKAGLRFIDSIDMPKDIAEISQSKYLKELFDKLDRRNQLKILERLSNAGHHLFCVKRP